MSDNEGDELVSRENEWEVVTLTESAYAAAPGPKQGVVDSGTETDHVMLMSGHFEYSPSNHENLPSEPEKEESGKSDSKHEENLSIEGLFDGKGDNISYYTSDLGGVASSNLIQKDPSMYSAEEGSGIAEPFESLENMQKHNEENKYNEPSDIPCEAWWRNYAASIYGHAKNANPLWSIVVVAAFVGLVVIGHRWQRNRPQVFQLKQQLVIDDKGSGWILGPVTRLKDVNLSGRHSSYIRVSSFAEH